MKRLPSGARPLLPSGGPIITAPSHTHDAYDTRSFPAIVDWCAEQVEKVNADAIVACGHSGLTVAGAVSYQTCVPVFAVRKPYEWTVAHNVSEVTGVAPYGRAFNWVWLDDFIDTGKTFARAAGEVWRSGLVRYPYPVAMIAYQGTTQPIPFSHVWKEIIDPTYELFPDSLTYIGRLPKLEPLSDLSF